VTTSPVPTRRSPTPGKTVGGTRLYGYENCLDRETALRMWTENVTWFSDEEGRKGRIEVGQFADLIVEVRA
jgi:predicted amidohydrolase YtcJ